MFFKFFDEYWIAKHSKSLGIDQNQSHPPRAESIKHAQEKLRTDSPIISVRRRKLMPNLSRQVSVQTCRKCSPSSPFQHVGRNTLAKICRVSTKPNSRRPATEFVAGGNGDNARFARRSRYHGISRCESIEPGGEKESSGPVRRLSGELNIAIARRSSGGCVRWVVYKRHPWNTLLSRLTPLVHSSCSSRVNPAISNRHATVTRQTERSFAPFSYRQARLLVRKEEGGSGGFW